MTAFTRRTMLQGAVALTAAGVTARFAGSARAQAAASTDRVKALIFDVFGTLVDWRNGVAREAQRILRPLGYEIDWHAFADAWRGLSI